MQIRIETKESAVNCLRKAGYGFLGQDQEKGDLSFAKRVTGNEYPRFHAYIQKNESILIINLHLDQKRPSYGGASHAHNAEYDGQLVEKEAQRIKNIIALI
ncbi:MAG TPA: hypothetical protein PK367_02315 [Candidatus Paceibacterota bacterium]|nr:hypothetical protein [Candidatus Magasanikbacteria bacterium]HPW34571.1 hypothetical protein [Candidatus Paceibacterota bacterium]